MPLQKPEDDDRSALERARERLYTPDAEDIALRKSFSSVSRTTPHTWRPALPKPPKLSNHHVRLAGYFLAGAVVFFLASLGAAVYLLYYGGNAVSTNNIDLQVEGPSTIAGGDTVPLSIAITNRNTADINNVALEIDFPPGTRSADNLLEPLTTYNEAIGTLTSGETITESVRAVVFGAAGDTLTLPVTLSYGTPSSNATFVKKTSYPIAISSTPLSVSVDTVSQAVSDKPFDIRVQVRNNATVPLANVVVAGAFPSGFTMSSSSLKAVDSSFLLGTLAPGASQMITISGYLEGQDADQRVFHFTVGTASDPSSSSVAVSYMTQDATVAIVAPFIATTLTIGGTDLSSATLAPGSTESVNVSYANTLSTNVNDATIAITLSGNAVDYTSIETPNGFYDSGTHTILFSKDTDPSLASLAPGATGVGTFTFNTLLASQFGQSPSVTFTTSVSGTRTGQSNVPEQVSASQVQTIKAATTVALSATTLHASGPLTDEGPVPPVAGQSTAYTIEWKVVNAQSPVAGGTVTATLPSYVTYTGKTSGAGVLSYDPGSRTVTWSTGDLAAGGSATGDFQVVLTPSSSQHAMPPALTSQASFSGYDRFAGIAISATAQAVTSEPTGDPGYVSGSGEVQ